MSARRLTSAVILGFLCAALAALPAVAAEEKTVLAYSIKDARAFLWQIHYPQSTFVSEFYGPCDPEADIYECDRTRYNQKPGTCDEEVALGRTKEAPETPTPEEVAEEGVTDDGGTWAASDWPRGNPVTVIHGMAFGRLGSTGEAGGHASMYYVDNSGRRETEAHAESDAFVGNRNDFEERCAAVDAFSETGMYDGPFSAHVLSRAGQTPSTYNMAAFTTAESADANAPPGRPKESVSIVKLWEAGGRVHGVLTSTVRGARLADQITVDAVRSVVSFSSDGTKEGLVAVAKSVALGVTIGETRIDVLDAGRQPVIALGEDTFLGVARPVVQASDDGRQVTIRAPGLFLAAKTPLNELPIPEDPFQNEEPAGALRDSIGDLRAALCEGFEQDQSEPPCRLTIGGRLFGEQVVYVAGAILDASVNRVPPFQFLPNLPPLPPLPVLPPQIPPPALTVPPPVAGVPQPTQPVAALPRFEVRQLSGSPWPLASIVAFAAMGFLAIMGRWSMRFGWARSLSRFPPFPAVGWTYRAFLKG